MKKNVLRVLSYVLVAFVAAGTTVVCFLVSQRNSAGKLDELQYLIDGYYIGQVDQAALEDAAADAIVQALDDEWSYYMTAEEYAAHQEASSNSYVGVGITVQAREDQQGIDIIEVIEGGPALDAGLLVGDRLICVGDTSVVGMDIDKVAGLIRGEEGSSVDLTVSRKSYPDAEILVYLDQEVSDEENMGRVAQIEALSNVDQCAWVSREQSLEDQRPRCVVVLKDNSLMDRTVEQIRQIQGVTHVDPPTAQVEELTFTLERRRFQTPVATYELLEGDVGLIRIENFDSRCALETVVAVETLLQQGADALIFDVRNNPGGYKDELVEVLDYLLPEGEVFRSEDHNGKEEIDYSDASYVDAPMAVLVNLSSYSAAEFFAAALDEYDAAVVVGEKTYGKGYFQSTFELSDGSAVNLSIGKYYTPKGKSLAGVGLTPDVEVPVDDETAAAIYYGTLDPAEDPQIQAAIKALGY